MTCMPTLAIRADAGVAWTAEMFLPKFAGLNSLENLKLTQPFLKIINGAGVKETLIHNWLGVLCFCLSDVPSDGTITAEMAMMMGEFYDEDVSPSRLICMVYIFPPSSDSLPTILQLKLTQYNLSIGNHGLSCRCRQCAVHHRCSGKKN